MVPIAVGVMVRVPLSELSFQSPWMSHVFALLDVHESTVELPSMIDAGVNQAETVGAGPETEEDGVTVTVAEPELVAPLALLQIKP